MPHCLRQIIGANRASRGQSGPIGASRARIGTSFFSNPSIKNANFSRIMVPQNGPKPFLPVKKSPLVYAKHLLCKLDLETQK